MVFSIIFEILFMGSQILINDLDEKIAIMNLVFQCFSVVVFSLSHVYLYVMGFRLIGMFNPKKKGQRSGGCTANCLLWIFIIFD